MITVTSVVGNIFHDKDLMGKFREMDLQKKCERIKISRHEMERGRIRRTTTAGTDIGLVLDSGLFHGDIVLSEHDRIVMVEQLPEKVISINIKDMGGNPEGLLMLGHVIGNRHKPISIKDGKLTFPVQADSEVDIFRQLLSGVMGNLEVVLDEQIFQPQHGMNIHEH